MNRKSVLALFITLILTVTSLYPALSAAGQSRQARNRSDQEDNSKEAAKALRIVERYSEGDSIGKDKKNGQIQAQRRERPQWADAALRSSIEQLQQNPEKYQVLDAQSEFEMLQVTKDGRGYTDVRLRQLHNGVEVFGSQLIAHLDDNNVLVSVAGRIFPDARIDTTAAIDEAQAIEAAKAAFGHTGEFAEEPSASLVILPNQIVKGKNKEKGATLTYLVNLHVEEGAETGNHKFFINAVDGTVTWRYNDTHYESGVGKGYYNGRVTVNTVRALVSPFNFIMMDPDRGLTEVRDGNFSGSIDSAGNFVRDNVGSTLFDADNVWGNNRLSNTQTLAVDVHYGIQKSWDYFFERGQNGPDGQGSPLMAFVRSRFFDPTTNTIYDDNASANTPSSGTQTLRFGVGNGQTTRPWTSIDVVGHEFTHLVTAKTAGLIYMNESGAVNESFSDIFGTAIEFYVGPINNRQPDYLIAEDIYLTSGNFLRDMADPPRASQPDRYSDFVNTTSDSGGVHTNSGIMNKAFYLMAEGGDHNGTFVPKIGIDTATELFFLTLTRELGPSDGFLQVAEGMLRLARQYPGQYGENVVRSVERAWFAVGVLSSLTPDQLPVPDVTESRAVFYNPTQGWTEVGSLDASGEYQTQRIYLGGVATGWSHIVDMGNKLFFYNARTGFAAVANVDSAGSIQTTLTYTRRRNFGSTPIRPLTDWTHVTYSNGYLLFYDSRDGALEFGEITPTGYRFWHSGTLSRGWTHITGVGDKLLFYNTNTGAAGVARWNVIHGTNFGEVLDVNLIGIRNYTFGPGWTHVINAGPATSTAANNRGILFYSSGNGLYRIGDIDPETGAYTDRTSLDSRWSYSMLQPGWTNIVRMGEGLFFYSDANDSAMVGYVLTASEGDTFAREPFQVVKSYIGNFYLEPYSMLASTLAF